MFKKIFLIIIAFAVFVNAAYAQYYPDNNENIKHENGGYDIDVVYNIANIGIDFNIYGSGNYLSMFTAEVANIYLQERETSLGLHFSPFLYVTGSDENEMYRKISPLNLTVFWNPVWSIKRGGIFGPYVSVNYFLSEKNDFSFGTGLYFSLFSNYSYDGSFINNVVSAKVGYRYINDRNTYYIGINTDIAQLLKLLLLGLLSSGSNKYDDDYSSSFSDNKKHDDKKQKHKEREHKERKSKENKPKKDKKKNKKEAGNAGAS
ncbi:MAG: hypothetical protein FWD54_00500 [Endomicrobia bacterium]|nr:hypothetical protein [Endomicrobiia bacterium]MCL2798753.1 hypothetical protein [Endomicrobiia bacterium]